METCNTAELRLEAPEPEERGIDHRRSLEQYTSSKSGRIASMSDIEDEKNKKEGACPASPSRLPKCVMPAQQQVVINIFINCLSSGILHGLMYKI